MKKKRDKKGNYKKKITTFMVDPEIKSVLKEISFKTGRSMGEFYRESIIKNIQEYEAKGIVKLNNRKNKNL